MLGVGVVGCGTISGTYLRVLRRFRTVEVVAVADAEPSRARAHADELGIAALETPEALLERPDVDLVLNLTPPTAHAGVSRAAVAAGRHVYSEKPLAVSRADGAALLAEARGRGVRVGAAPDTFLGGALQRARELVDGGEIGRPVAAKASFLSRGWEDWHPNPTFLYAPGGGPLLDMGPYYLTALVALLGPVRRVTAAAGRAFEERMITSLPLRGEKIRVETPTHVVGAAELASGAIVSLETSFDVWDGSRSLIVYGADGTLEIPDPNFFGGELRVRSNASPDWHLVPPRREFDDESRGLGVADLAAALASGRPHRASGDLAYHVLDAMLGMLDAAAEGRHVELESTCERPAPLAPGEASAWLEVAR